MYIDISKGIIMNLKGKVIYCIHGNNCKSCLRG